MNLLFCLFVAKIIRNFIIFLRLFCFCLDNPDKTTVVINKVSVKTIPLLADKISPLIKGGFRGIVDMGRQRPPLQAELAKPSGSGTHTRKKKPNCYC